MKSEPFSFVMVLTGISNSIIFIGLSMPKTVCYRESQDRWVSPFSYPFPVHSWTNAPAACFWVLVDAIVVGASINLPNLLIFRDFIAKDCR